jgi:hypothetical protein
MAAAAVAAVAIGLAGPANGGLGLTGPALALEEPAVEPGPLGGDVFGPGLQQLGPGPGGERGQGPGAGMRARAAAMMQPVADLLGMTPAEVMQERRAGKSLAEIAATRGVDQATLVQTITGAARTRLDQAVADGRLPQERADAITQRAQEFAERMVTRTELPCAQLRARGQERMQERQQRGGGERPERPERGPRGGQPPHP